MDLKSIKDKKLANVKVKDIDSPIEILKTQGAKQEQPKI
jgi:hypothetical protein